MLLFTFCSFKVISHLQLRWLAQKITHEKKKGRIQWIHVSMDAAPCRTTALEMHGSICAAIIDLLLTIMPTFCVIASYNINT